MPQTVATLADVMKEVWTQERLEKQFYDENPFLDRLDRESKYSKPSNRKVNGVKIGEEAHVPIHTGRSGGYTATLAAGSSALNPAGAQQVGRATYTVPYHWFQIELEAAVMAQTGDLDQAIIDGKDLEMEGAIADTRNQIARQVVTNGDGIIARCGTTAGSTEVELDPTHYGYDALLRGWLYPGLPVDIGTLADEDADVAGSEITAVEEDPATPSITIGTSITTDTSDFVSIANSRSGTTSKETSGLRTIVGSETSAVGGLDPDTAGEEYWKPAHVDTSSTTLSLALALRLQRHVRQKTGKNSNYVLTSLKQQERLYSLLQSQERYMQGAIGAGEVEKVKWRGQEIEALPDIPDREWYSLTLEDFFLVTGGGRLSKPTWATDLFGSGGSLQWGPGTTAASNAVVYPLQLAIRRRNSHAAAIGLTAGD